MRNMGEFIGLVSIVMLFGIPIVGVVGHYGYAAFKAWLEIGLKRDMVARDYTAEEIVEVLAATRGTSRARSLPNAPAAKPVRQEAYQ